MKYLLLGLLSAYFAPFVAAQTPCAQPKTAAVYPNSYQCYWQIDVLTDTLPFGEVLAHAPNHVPCAFESSASVTIVKVGRDTLRILDLCDERNWPVGTQVGIAPVAAPYMRVRIPAYFEPTTSGQFLYHCQPQYDTTVRPTYWGQLY